MSATDVFMLFYIWLPAITGIAWAVEWSLMKFAEWIVKKL